MEKEDLREKSYLTEPVVDVVIPVYKPAREFKQLIERLLKQTCQVHKIILIITKSEDDETSSFLEEITEAPEVKDKIVWVEIEKEQFNHGLTRNLGVSLSTAEFVVMMTQDALPADRQMLHKLLEPFKKPEVCVTYARQLPKKDCREVERYVRFFNYPGRDMEKTRETMETLGIKSIFCSDVCAAYRCSEHNRLGGFKETDFNEDMLFAYEAIMAGKTVYYASGAKVLHSHNYTCLQQFKRNMEIGRSQKQFREVFQSFRSENEGIRMLKTGIRYLIKQKKWYYIPELMISSGFKFLGFKIGYSTGKA